MKPKMIVVVGETASGKSALALRLAQRHNGEIICADSSTIRHQADIGTAKPSLAEQKLVPHHLLDIAEPDEDFSAADFKQRAEQVIAEIVARGRLPIMVGGTGLYVDSVLYNYQFRAPADSGLREQLSSMDVTQLQQLAGQRGLDLDSIDTSNPHRLIRLIETDGQVASKQPLRENTLIFGLSPGREELTERITQRVDVMLAQGLEQEVRDLSERYGWQAPALKSIGYSEWQNYFLNEQALDETRARIIKDTKDLAKRQRTWFKRNKSIHWLSTPVKWQVVDDLVTTFLEN